MTSTRCSSLLTINVQKEHRMRSICTLMSRQARGVRAQAGRQKNCTAGVCFATVKQPTPGISCGVLQVGGIIETKRPDQKNALYLETIRRGDLLLNRVQKLSRVVDVD